MLSLSRCGGPLLGPPFRNKRALSCKERRQWMASSQNPDFPAKAIFPPEPPLANDSASGYYPWPLLLNRDSLTSHLCSRATTWVGRDLAQIPGLRLSLPWGCLFPFIQDLTFASCFEDFLWPVLLLPPLLCNCLHPLMNLMLLTPSSHGPKHPMDKHLALFHIIATLQSRQ